MSCSNCNKRRICKIYDCLREYLYEREIELSKCIYKEDTIKQQSNPIDNSITPKKELEVKKYTNFNVKDTEERKENPLVEELDIKVIRDSEQLNALIVKCPSCDGETTDNDINVCSKCEEVLCSNCSTLYEKRLFCDKCWKDM